MHIPCGPVCLNEIQSSEDYNAQRKVAKFCQSSEKLFQWKCSRWCTECRTVWNRIVPQPTAKITCWAGKMAAVSVCSCINAGKVGNQQVKTSSKLKKFQWKKHCGKQGNNERWFKEETYNQEQQIGQSVPQWKDPCKTTGQCASQWLNDRKEETQIWSPSQCQKVPNFTYSHTGQCKACIWIYSINRYQRYCWCNQRCWGTSTQKLC